MQLLPCLVKRSYGVVRICSTSLKQSSFKLPRILTSVQFQKSFLSCRNPYTSVIPETRSLLLRTDKFVTRSYSSLATASKMQPEKEAFQRLPTNVIPKNYAIRLEPNLETFVFQGQQTVQVEVNEPTNTVLLNALDLEIHSASWQGSDGTKVDAVVALDEAKETATLTFAEPLPVSTGTLQFTFTGSLNDKMKGFYRSKYRTPAGEERFSAVTQFESTDARRAFPCWDEPAHKATFDIQLVAQKGKVALSNMPVKQITPLPNNEDLLEYTYERTPIMSTYLVAFVIGEFDYIEATSADGVLCRVYTPVGKKDQGKFALDVTVKVLPYYKDYFGIAYPLPKMDLIAIADFSSGAMENWGLVTYRETALLVDETQTSATNRQWVAIVVGHELAHQWFGNLVTMEWWTHLWLNEGYASFTEFLCVDHLFPEYDIWTQFVTETLTRALELDALDTSHPIEVPVGHPSEIDEIFDAISYEKGAAIIRMLHDFIGMNDFKRGMNLYLTRHQYENAFTEDLWKALEDSSKKPVGAIMSTWTKQMGFPLITVTQQQKGNSRVLSISQEKFCSSPTSRDVGNQDYQWLIPMVFSAARNPSQIAHEALMDKKSMEVTIDGIDENQWVKVNPNSIGFYRVSYSPDMLAQLVPAIRDRTLPPLDRLGVVDDLFALVQAGKRSTVDVLQILEAFVNENNYTVWASISNIIGSLNLLLDGTPVHHQFKTFGRKLFSNIENKVGWEARANESHLDALLRSLVLGRMVSFGNESTVNEAKARFSNFLRTGTQLHADLRSVVYKAILSFGDEEVLQKMIELYRNADSLEEKDRIGRALGSIKDRRLLQQVLDFSLSDDVRAQDTVFVIIGVGIHHAGRDLAWQFFQDNFQVFKDRYSGGHLGGRVIKHVLENYSSDDKAAEVESYFTKNPFPSTERTVQQACESIRLNAQWLSRDYEKIAGFLTEKAAEAS